jgi:hypothetical protein
MAYTIRRAEYFYTTVNDEPGDRYQLLTHLAGLGINLLAFTGMPLGPTRTQLTLFPEDPALMIEAARKAGLALDGPHTALLVQGDDELGAFARIHARLHEAQVNVYASSGVVGESRGTFGYILYVRPEDYARAVQALGL